MCSCHLAIYPNISVTIAVSAKRPNQAAIAVIFDVLFLPLFGQSTFGHSSKSSKKNQATYVMETARCLGTTDTGDQSKKTGRALVFAPME
jgi:hypothetical protein